MKHYVMEENKDALYMSTSELKESLRAAISGKQNLFILEVSRVKKNVEQKPGKDLINDEWETDMHQIGLVRSNSVKEISLFENLLFFFRQVAAAGMDFDHLKGLSDTFIRSYCSMLDLVQMELLVDNDSDRIESSNLVAIMNYLRMIFDKLSRKIS